MSKASPKEQHTPFERLLAATRSASPGKRESHSATLETFLGTLTTAGINQIVTSCRKLLRREQDELYSALVEARHASDPLLVALRRADERWIDALPNPPDHGPPRRTVDEWYAIFKRSELPEEDAREHAVALAQSPDEVERGFLLANGFTPTEADTEAEKRRRGEKFRAANMVIDSIALAAHDRVKEDALREECSTIAKGAAIVAKEIAGLIAQPGGAASLRDGLSNALANAIDRAIVAGNPDAPKVGTFVLVARSDLQPARDRELHRWGDVAFAAQDLANDIAEGRQQDDARIAGVSRDVAVMATQARDMAARLQRDRGRPAKLALDAAEALRAYGCTWQQVAELLDRRKLYLDPHTPESIRKSVLARKRQPPAKKSPT